MHASFWLLFSTNIYIYIYTHTHTYAYIFICRNTVQLYAYTYTWVHMHVFMYIHMYVYVYLEWDNVEFHGVVVFNRAWYCVVWAAFRHHECAVCMYVCTYICVHDVYVCACMRESIMWAAFRHHNCAVCMYVCLRAWCVCVCMYERKTSCEPPLATTSALYVCMYVCVHACACMRQSIMWTSSAMTHA